MNLSPPSWSKPETETWTTHRPPPLLPVMDVISPHPSPGPTSTPKYGPYKVQKTGNMIKKRRKRLGKTLRRTMTIDSLPDDVLLQIFDFYRHHPLQWPSHPVLDWHRLIHVCRRWRQIMFSSPRRLGLYLLCRHGTPVRKNLGLWPAFPIMIQYDDPTLSSNDEDNIIAALEHPDRVRYLKLPVTSSMLEKVATVGQEPFPILTRLWLSSEGGSLSVLPSAFLGGSAPRLREIHLEGIPFPTLSTLLLSTPDLTVLYLSHIPHTGYISPEAMVTSLAALTRLKSLSIGFQSPTSRPNPSRRRTAPPTRAVLPALTCFGFRGASEYLEDLVAQIDAPRLTSIQIKYFNQLVFQVPQLFRFISHTQIIEQARTIVAAVNFYPSSLKIRLSAKPAEHHQIFFDLQISCQGLDWQVPHLAEVLSQSSAVTVLSNVRQLSIRTHTLQSSWRHNMDNTDWLALLRPFTTVEALLDFSELSGHVADALKDATAEMAPEILPALRLLYLGDEPAGYIEKFVTARQLSDLPPIAIASTEAEFFSRRRQLFP